MNGIEPLTRCLQNSRSTKLSYTGMWHWQRTSGIKPPTSVINIGRRSVALRLTSVKPPRVAVAIVAELCLLAASLP